MKYKLIESKPGCRCLFCEICVQQFDLDKFNYYIIIFDPYSKIFKRFFHVECFYKNYLNKPIYYNRLKFRLKCYE